MVPWALMRTRPSRRASSIRVLALAFAYLILADLSQDGNCDRFLASGATGLTISAAAQSGTADACLGQCVPDCFCCSRGLAAGQSVLPPSPSPGVPAAQAAGLAAPAGILPLPYHPPQLRV
jgi:hypothetical protein